MNHVSPIDSNCKKMLIPAAARSEMRDLENVTFSIEYVTPEIAAGWLESSSGNRKLIPSNTKALVNDILNGNFCATHQGVAIDENGRMIDGNHRADAICASGVGVVLVVSRGWPHDISAPIDQGARRDPAWIAVLQGVITEEQRSKAGPLTAALTLLEKRFVPKMTPGLIEIAFTSDRKDGLVWACKHSAAKVSVSVLAALAYAYPVAPQQIQEFYEAVKTGIGLKAGDPALALREAVKPGDRKSDTRLAIMLKTLRCAQVYVEGGRLSKCQLTEQGFEHFRACRGWS